MPLAVFGSGRVVGPSERPHSYGNPAAARAEPRPPGGLFSWFFRNSLRIACLITLPNAKRAIEREGEAPSEPPLCDLIKKADTGPP